VPGGQLTWDPGHWPREGGPKGLPHWHITTRDGIRTSHVFYGGNPPARSFFVVP
jgi:hypothetical protein